MKRLKKILVWISVSVGFVIAALFLVLAIMNAIWGAELRKTIAGMKARGEPMTIAEIVPAYVPPEKNAAVEFHKAFALMCGDKPDERYIPFKQGKIKPDLEKVNDYFTKKSRDQVSAEDTKKILELANSPQLAEIFDVLNAAAAKPECNFDIRYEDGVTAPYPNMGILRTAIKLSSLKALARANKGDIVGACDTLMTSIKVSNHLRNEPALVMCLVRVACLQMTANTLNDIADNFQIPEENAKSLIVELEKINTTESLKKAFIGELWGFGQIIDRVISGKFGYNYICSQIYYGPPPGDASRLAYFVWKLFIKRDYCEYLRITSLYPKVCDKPFYSSGEAINRIENDISHIPRYCVFSRMFTPNLTGIFERNAEFQTKRAISKIKLALNIYKGKNIAFPENLEQLKPEILREIPIDELTGTPLTYKKDGEKYILFSAAVRKLEEDRKLER